MDETFLQVADVRWMKRLRALNELDEYKFRRKYIDGLLRPGKHSLHEFWSSHKKERLQKLAREATLHRSW